MKCVVACAVGLILAIFAGGARAQVDPTPPDSGVGAGDATPANADTPISPPPGSDSGSSGVKAPEEYGLWVLAPAAVAILLAMILRQAVPALFMGVLVGGYMLIPCSAASNLPSGPPWMGGLRLAVETYLIEAIWEPTESGKGHILIMVFTLTIGAMVGIIGANGGTRGLVEWVARFASTSRKGQLTGWLAGMIVFFDDYANSMIVGPTLRPMYDRLRISRAKLAYIVDSTAAPVASIALLGTWLGAELGYIQDGLDAVAANGAPEFMANMDKWDVFLQSIPYRFYPIFALWMVFVVAITGRDFGPMRGAESRALAEHPPTTNVGGVEPKSSSGWLAALPIMALVGVTVAALYATGKEGLPEGTEASVRDILSSAESYISILYGALASAALALILSVLARACSIRVAMDGALDGIARMSPAIVILVLAWALSQVSQDLKLGTILSDRLLVMDLAPEWLPLRVWLPLIVFLCAAGVSFATGTSWATMAILTPITVEVAAAAAIDNGMPMDQASALFYAAVGSVLAGAIFGDHCSPISDTTVLSAVASSCRVEEHVWTQMPYAILVAIVAMGAGNVFCMYQNQPAWMGLAIGAGAILVFMFVIGRRPKAPRVPLAPVPAETIERRLAPTPRDMGLSALPGEEGFDGPSQST